MSPSQRWGEALITAAAVVMASALLVAIAVGVWKVATWLKSALALVLTLLTG